MHLLLTVALISSSIWSMFLLRRAALTKIDLRESELRFNTLAAAAPSLIWMSGKDGKVCYLNETHQAFTGGRPPLAAAESWLDDVHPDDVCDVVSSSASALQNEKAFSREYRLRRYDGVYRWV